MLKQSACLCIILVVLLTGSISTAGDFGKNQHDMEILFDISGLDNIGLNSFDGGLGFRYYFLDGFTIRPNFSYSTESNTTSYENYDGAVSERDQYSFDLVIEKHFLVGEKFVPYLGLGYSAGESTSDETIHFESDPEIGQYTGRRYTNDFHSFLGILGVQWQAYRTFSLGCEYRIEYRNSDSKQETFRHEDDTRFQSTWGNSFNTSTSSLYIAVGF